jgi:hypothetical protein
VLATKSISATQSYKEVAKAALMRHLLSIPG